MTLRLHSHNVFFGRVRKFMSTATFLHAAEKVGARLCSDAQWSGDYCTWVGAALERSGSQSQVTRGIVGPEIYSGSSGIGLFLAYLFSCTHEQNFKKTAEGAIRYAHSHLDRLSSADNFGFYSGLTGLAYVMAESARIFSTQQFAEQSLAILRGLNPSAANSLRWDIVSGSAGVIPVLLKLHGAYGEEFLLDLALRYGDLLLQNVSWGEEGW